MHSGEHGPLTAKRVWVQIPLVPELWWSLSLQCPHCQAAVLSFFFLLFYFKLNSKNKQKLRKLAEIDYLLVLDLTNHYCIGLAFFNIIIMRLFLALLLLVTLRFSLNPLTFWSKSSEFCCFQMKVCTETHLSLRTFQAPEAVCIFQCTSPSIHVCV